MTEVSDKKADVSEVKKVDFLEWCKQAEALFGEDKKLWRFVCANCGHIQTIADFIELRTIGEVGKDFNCGVAWYSCIGRYDTRIPREKIGTLGDCDGKDYCNYTLGGLVPLNKTIVVKDDKEIPVLEFDTDDGGKSNDEKH